MLRRLVCLVEPASSPAAGPPESDTTAMAPADHAESIQAVCYDRLGYPNENHRRTFLAYIHLSNVAFHVGCRDVLEIGAGLSTVIWSRYAERLGARVCTVDVDFGRLETVSSNPADRERISRHVERIEGATITADDLRGFYSHPPRETYAGVPAARLAEHLQAFVRADGNLAKRTAVEALAGREDWRASELLVRNNRLTFPRSLLDAYAVGGSFNAEAQWLERTAEEVRSGVLDDMGAAGRSWDLVFFDSGELASMVEWPKLKDRIRPGGLAAFHDIYFPKSIKNFVTCAAVVADPAWRVLFIDSGVRQGMLIAQRVE